MPTPPPHDDLGRRYCSRCQWKVANSKGLCKTCYTYKLRTGKDRPWELINAAAERDMERRESARLARLRGSRA